MGRNAHRTLAKLARTPDAPGPLVQRDWAVLNDGIAIQEVIMSEPFIFIGSYQVKPGHLEEARHRLRDVSALVEGREGPGLGRRGASSRRFVFVPRRDKPWSLRRHDRTAQGAAHR